ncbi:hypothetical protein D9758_011157 [Tetrapyrgos nigripes]|uniref:BTB domain-containing protein n=1 Tax=Tetrapyrgos nigripes TaxID=182062 RepID=A0A8H5FMW1_9AGAR|nr:hypothetical protein D9758_011157 [Tetrapyrgos nigripes]
MSATVSPNEDSSSTTAPPVSKICEYYPDSRILCLSSSSFLMYMLDFGAVNAETGGEIVFKSSDSVLFYIHSKNLEFMSEGFPPVDNIIPPRPENPVVLTEDSTTLEFLFQFTYPRMPPDLDDLGFDGVMKLAEAADKYGIHQAMGFCVQELRRRFTQSKTFEIFILACQHGHEKLMYELAPLLVHRPLSQFVHKIPVKLYVPWSLYHDQFREQPLPLQLAEKHLTATKQFGNLLIPAACMGACVYSHHHQFWANQIEDWRKRTIEECLSCCAIGAMIDSSYAAAPSEVRGGCCTMYKQLMDDLKKEFSKSSSIMVAPRRFEDFVTEYREAQVRFLCPLGLYRMYYDN